MKDYSSRDRLNRVSEMPEQWFKNTMTYPAVNKNSRNHAIPHTIHRLNDRRIVVTPI
jgi:hypothetical protein